MLLKRDILERIGGLDEQLRSVCEHFDLALKLREKDQKVFYEPMALATYIPPQQVPWFDLPYFEIRWCEEWTVPSVEHFRKKWGYDRIGYAGEKEADLIDDTIVKWARGHRGSVVGTQVSADEINFPSDPTQGELELIVSAFLTVEHNKFDIAVHTREQQAAFALNNRTAEEVFRYVDSRLVEFLQGDVGFDIYPAPTVHARVPCLIQLQDLSDSDLSFLAKHAFLVLKSKHGKYDCWFAVSLHAGKTAASVREFAERMGARPDTRGNRNAICLNSLNNNSHRLHLLNAGQILTESAFSRLAVGPYAESMVILEPKATC